MEEPYSSPSYPPSSSSEKDSGGQRNSFGDSTELVQPTLVSSTGTDIGPVSTVPSDVQVTAVPPIRPANPSSSVGIPQSDSMACIRRRFETAGFSPEVVQILLLSWSESTRKRYTGPWRTWADWSTVREWYSRSAPLTAVLTFLALLTDRDLEYRTIAVYRSAISQTHDPIGSASLGELLLCLDL